MNVFVILVAICLTLAAPSNGRATTWSAWTPCSVTCGGGVRTRSVQCNPNVDARCTTRRGVQVERCHVSPCAPQASWTFPELTNGRWSRWSGWSGCFGDCGSSVRTKWRNCLHGHELVGYLHCSGRPFKTKPCVHKKCQTTTSTVEPTPAEAISSAQPSSTNMEPETNASGSDKSIQLEVKEATADEAPDEGPGGNLGVHCDLHCSPGQDCKKMHARCLKTGKGAASVELLDSGIKIHAFPDEEGQNSKATVVRETPKENSGKETVDKENGNDEKPRDQVHVREELMDGKGFATEYLKHRLTDDRDLRKRRKHRKWSKSPKSKSRSRASIVEGIANKDYYNDELSQELLEEGSEGVERKAADREKSKPGTRHDNDKPSQNLAKEGVHGAGGNGAERDGLKPSQHYDDQLSQELIEQGYKRADRKSDEIERKKPRERLNTKSSKKGKINNHNKVRTQGKKASKINMRNRNREPIGRERKEAQNKRHRHRKKPERDLKINTFKKKPKIRDKLNIKSNKYDKLSHRHNIRMLGKRAPKAHRRNRHEALGSGEGIKNAMQKEKHNPLNHNRVRELGKRASKVSIRNRKDHKSPKSGKSRKKRNASVVDDGTKFEEEPRSRATLIAQGFGKAAEAAVPPLISNEQELADTLETAQVTKAPGNSLEHTDNPMVHPDKYMPVKDWELHDLLDTPGTGVPTLQEELAPLVGELPDIDESPWTINQAGSAVAPQEAEAEARQEGDARGLQDGSWDEEGRRDGDDTAVIREDLDDALDTMKRHVDQVSNAGAPQQADEEARGDSDHTQVRQDVDDRLEGRIIRKKRDVDREKEPLDIFNEEASLDDDAVHASLAAEWPPGGQYPDWAEWSNCSSTCGVGFQERSRRCHEPTTCQGQTRQLRACVGQSRACTEDIYQRNLMERDVYKLAVYRHYTDRTYMLAFAFLMLLLGALAVSMGCYCRRADRRRHELIKYRFSDQSLDGRRDP